MNATQTLTVSDLIALATVVETAQHNAKVSRVRENGDIINGTARSVGNERGSFATSNDDVRNLYLRVTTQNGFEAFWPISELAEQVKTGHFAAYDW